MKIRTVSEEFKEMFGTKVMKLSLSSGCTCPNRDGSVGTGGCTFCSAGGSGEFAAPFLPLPEQIAMAKTLVDQKFPPSIPVQMRRYLAYFQSFSNTYGDTQRLEKLYQEALDYPEIVGLSIGTRPDCLEEDKVEMLARLNAQKPVWVELGLQTIHEKSAERIHRGYPLSVYTDAHNRLKAKGLRVVTHVILGLPGETREDMLETIGYLAGLQAPADGIKLHMLCILKGTQLEKEYSEQPFPVMTMDEYIDLVIDCLHILPEGTVIHRMTGDPPRSLVREPLWSLNKKKVLNTLNARIRNEA